MNIREFQRRAGILIEGVDVDAVSYELARANKQELASILSKAAAVSSDLYSDRSIVQALQAALDKLNGEEINEEETQEADTPKRIHIDYNEPDRLNTFHHMDVYVGDGKKSISSYQTAEELMVRILGPLAKFRSYIPGKYWEEELNKLKAKLAEKGINLTYFHND